MPKIKVSCESCRLIRKVEGADSLPPCSECGGTLRPFDWDAEEAAEAAASAPPAPAHASPPPMPRAGRRSASVATRTRREDPLEAEADPAARRRGNLEVAKALGAVKLVQALFVALAVLLGLGCLMSLWALMQLGRLDLHGVAELRMAVYISLGIYGAFFLFYLAGALLCPRQPYPWSVALALAVSLNLAGSVFTIDLSQWFDLLSLAITVFLAIAAWAATIRISKLRPLLEQYGDTVAGQRARGERRRVQGGDTTARAHARSLQRDRRSGAPVLAYAIVGIVAVILIVVVIVGSSGPSLPSGPTPEEIAAQRDAAAQTQREREQRYEATILRFQNAWARNDRDAIAAMAPEGPVRERAMGMLARSLERYGFEGELPRIADRREIWPRREPDQVKSYFALPDQEGDRRAKLRIVWSWENDDWRLGELALTGTSRD